MIAQIAAHCTGYCDECNNRTECKEFLNFMDDAGRDFDNQYEVVIEELFSDPSAAEALEKSVFGEEVKTWTNHY